MEKKCDIKSFTFSFVVTRQKSLVILQEIYNSPTDKFGNLKVDQEYLQSVVDAIIYAFSLDKKTQIQYWDPEFKSLLFALYLFLKEEKHKDFIKDLLVKEK